LNSFRIETEPDELDVGLCVTSGQVFRWEAVEPSKWVGVDGKNWYVVCHVAPGVFEVESNTDRDEFVRLFRLNVDLKEVERQIVQRGPELQPYIYSLRGLRLMHPSSAFETLFCFLCTPNNHLSRITQMVRKLGAYGEPMVEVAGRTLTYFPSVERIADITESELRDGGFGYRARTIPNVARQILRKAEGWLESLKRVPYLEAQKELCTLDGVGPKLADCVALFGLHQMESAPMDTHLWQAVTRLYFPQWKDKPITDSKYREAAGFLRSRFGDLTGIAHQYLFYDNLLNWRARR
jgi:N-glycosylase/DNA lyase